jgi:ABC-type branched-subunit amino acid transport system ATPase component
MAHLTSLHIEGYRLFEKLDVEGLTRVNLIVGKNNAGKTALLNALEIYLSDTPLSTLLLQLDLREEKFVVPAILKENRPTSFLDTKPLFNGFRQPPGRTFIIVGDPNGAELRVTVSPLVDGETFIQLSVGEKEEQRILIGPLGGVASEIAERFRFSTLRSSRAAQFVPTELLSAKRLAEFWSEIALTPAENDVIEALKIVESKLVALNFLGNEFTSATGFGNVFVRLEGMDDRVSMASLGDGLKRMLAMSLKLVSAKGGTLLIDEIDTGLHHSTMIDMWRLIVETARRLDVQVFATTHSQDCLDAILYLQEERPELVEDISLHRLERGYPKTTRLSGRAIAAASERQIEVR